MDAVPLLAAVVGIALAVVVDDKVVLVETVADDLLILVLVDLLVEVVSVLHLVRVELFLARLAQGAQLGELVALGGAGHVGGRSCLVCFLSSVEGLVLVCARGYVVGGVALELDEEGTLTISWGSLACWSGCWSLLPVWLLGLGPAWFVWCWADESSVGGGAQTRVQQWVMDPPIQWLPPLYRAQSRVFAWRVEHAYPCN